MKTSLESIRKFTSQQHIAVAGVSRNKNKFGNSIFRELRKKGTNLYPINPHLDTFEGEHCYRTVSELPGDVTGIIICTKSPVSLKVADEAHRKGIRHIWFQQGSLDKKDMAGLDRIGVNIITGHCIMMFMEPVDSVHRFHRWIKRVFGSYPS